jgi:hypothetical protein
MSGRSGTGSWVFGPDNDSHNLIIAQYTMRRRATGWFVLGHVACFIYQSVWFLAKTNAPSVAIMRASASSKPILLLIAQSVPDNVQENRQFCFRFTFPSHHLGWQGVLHHAVTVRRFCTNNTSQFRGCLGPDL